MTIFLISSGVDRAKEDSFEVQQLLVFSFFLTISPGNLQFDKVVVVSCPCQGFCWNSRHILFW